MKCKWKRKNLRLKNKRNRNRKIFKLKKMVKKMPKRRQSSLNNNKNNSSLNKNDWKNSKDKENKEKKLKSSKCKRISMNNNNFHDLEVSLVISDKLNTTNGFYQFILSKKTIRMHLPKSTTSRSLLLQVRRLWLVIKLKLILERLQLAQEVLNK